MPLHAGLPASLPLAKICTMQLADTFQQAVFMVVSVNQLPFSVLCCRSTVQTVRQGLSEHVDHWQCKVDR